MSLGILVGRFGDFLEEQAPRADASPAPAPLPDDLAHLREAVGHHLVALTLLARFDGEFADSEREVILNHCLHQAKKASIPVTDATRKAFDDYLRTYTPARMQLAAAVKRMGHDSKHDLADLLAAAQAVVDADGEVRAAELKLLSDLRADLAKL